ncbi:hypothetical protein MMC34_002196 [Xylographa carneopallida]|nr:hypothetical protein [Xylographa carneopallida]
MQPPTLLAFLALLLAPSLAAVVSKPVPEEGATYSDGRTVHAGKIIPGKPIPAAPKPEHPPTAPHSPYDRTGHQDPATHHEDAHASHHHGNHKRSNPYDDLGAVVVARSPIITPKPPRDKKGKKKEDPDDVGHKPARKDDTPKFGPDGMKVKELQAAKEHHGSKHPFQGFTRRDLDGRGVVVVARDLYGPGGTLEHLQPNHDIVNQPASWSKHPAPKHPFPGFDRRSVRVRRNAAAKGSGRGGARPRG